MVWHEIQSIVTCMVLGAPRVSNLFKVQNKSCTFVWFSVRSGLNIQSISVCHISNERKQICDQIYGRPILSFSRGYTFWVMIESIYWSFLHTLFPDRLFCCSSVHSFLMAGRLSSLAKRHHSVFSHEDDHLLLRLFFSLPNILIVSEVFRRLTQYHVLGRYALTGP